MGNAQLRQDPQEEQVFADELVAGSTLMHGQYTIEAFLNAGGFGITYSARDSLDRRVVIKECFPGAFCRRSTALVTARSRAHQSELASIVRLFVQEARSLAKLDHPNIVGVHQVFEENNTAYMALDFVDGRDLLDVIESGENPLSSEDVEAVLRKILDAIRFVHDQGILHRDISPDNILLDGENEPVLIDFGAAREQATKQSRVLSALRVVKDGYSPQEFYVAGSDQGPYSDLYALGASFYHLVTGELPPNSQARLASVATGDGDPYRPLVDRLPTYRKTFLEALDQSLAILPKDRIASASAWLDMLDGKCDGAAAKPESTTNSIPKAEPVQPKSKKGLMLATVAVVAVIAGGIVITQTNSLNPTGASTETVAAGASENVQVSADPAPATDVPEIEDATRQARDATARSGATETASEHEAGEDNSVATPAPVFDTSYADGLRRAATLDRPEYSAPAPVFDTSYADGLRRAATHDRPEYAAAAPAFDTSYDDALLRAATTDRPAYAPLPAPLVAEIPPAIERFDAPGMLSGWSAVLPVEAVFDSVDPPRIIGVNGIATPTRDAFDRALRGTVAAPQTADLTVKVTLETAPGRIEEQGWILPIVHKTVLLNGLAFETAYREQAWVTQVTVVPEGLATDLQVGDVLLGHIATSTLLDTRTALPATLVQATSGRTNMSFAVVRDDNTWAVALPFGGETSN